MNNYQREKNGRKWLVAVVSGMAIMTVVCCIIAYNLYLDSVRLEQQQYNKGYHDAKQVYESQDFEYNEEKLLND